MKKVVIIKRLSNLYIGFKKNDQYYEIFKNPTSQEINDLKNQSEYNSSIRGVIYSNGDIYLWVADINHDSINYYLPRGTEQIDLTQYIIHYDGSENLWYIDVNKHLSFDETKELINKYKYIFNQISLNAEFSIFNTNDNVSFKRLSRKITV